MQRAVNSVGFDSRSLRGNIIVGTVDKCFVLGNKLFFFSMVAFNKAKVIQSR